MKIEAVLCAILFNLSSKNSVYVCVLIYSWSQTSGFRSNVLSNKHSKELWIMLVSSGSLSWYLLWFTTWSRLTPWKDSQLKLVWNLSVRFNIIWHNPMRLLYGVDGRGCGSVIMLDENQDGSSFKGFKCR